MPNYDLEKFAKVTESLDDLQPELEKPTARDVVDAAYDKIQEQVNKGIPHKQILRRYQEAGLKLSLGLFRQYLRDVGAKRKAERRRVIAEKAKATRARNLCASKADTDTPIKPQRNPSGITPSLPGLASIEGEIVDE